MFCMLENGVLLVPLLAKFQADAKMLVRLPIFNKEALTVEPPKKSVVFARFQADTSI